MSRRFSSELYYTWVSEGERIHPSWSVDAIERLYRRVLKALVYAGVPNAQLVTEELIEQADPSAPVWEFERWLRERLKAYGAVI